MCPPELLEHQCVNLHRRARAIPDSCLAGDCGGRGAAENGGQWLARGSGSRGAAASGGSWPFPTIPSHPCRQLRNVNDIQNLTPECCCADHPQDTDPHPPPAASAHPPTTHCVRSGSLRECVSSESHTARGHPFLVHFPILMPAPSDKEISFPTQGHQEQRGPDAVDPCLSTKQIPCEGTHCTAVSPERTHTF